MTKIAIYPGTFDPITYGHIDVIKKSLKLFNKIIVAVSDVDNKDYLFNSDERIEIVKNALCKDGSTQSQSPRNEIKMMQPERVAQHIISAVKKRKNSIVLTINGKLTVFLNKFFPKIVDSLVYNHMSKEEDSPF